MVKNKRPVAIISATLPQNLRNLMMMFYSVKFGRVKVSCRPTNGV
ncbi:hypothetical protein N624_2525 [Levilactobacillus brevis]|nr:hypothetical protein N624_2525 [Levilactobacillus brevis]